MALNLLMPVLVVDDSAVMIGIIRRMLRQLGYIYVDDAQDGITALAMMRAKRYGLVISDWNMDSMTGCEFLRDIRGDANLKRTPFIMMTADARTENVIAAKKAGVDNYIVKPFDAEALKAKIESVHAARIAVPTPS